MAGVRPTTISTSPKRADSAAQIRSHASASSNPAVRQSTCTDAIVGHGMSSSMCVIRSRSSKNSCACSGVLSSNTWTSTPPVKTLPSARTTSARGWSRFASSSAAIRSFVSSTVKRLSGWSSMTTRPMSPSREDATLATELVGHLRELVLVDIHRFAGQLERVVLVARDHVHVVVEDGLPGGRLGRVEQVHAVAAERVALLDRNPVRHLDRRVERLLRRLPEVARVLLRDHEGVPARPRVDVHERDRLLVLVDLLSRDLARHDLAEDAVVVGHEGANPTASRPS